MATFTRREASTASRGKLARKIEERFRVLVIADLLSAGFTGAGAGSVFTTQPIQPRKVLAPGKVLNAV